MSKENVIADINNFMNTVSTRDILNNKKKKKKEKVVQEKPKDMTLAEEIEQLSKSIDLVVDPVPIDDTFLVISHALDGGNFDEQGNPVVDDIMKKQSRSYTAASDDGSMVGLFNEEKLLLWNFITDQDKIVKTLEKRFNTVNDSRMSGVTKNYNDLVVSLDSARGTLLSAIQQSTNLKRQQAELIIKKEAHDAKINGTDDNQQNDEMFISSLMRQVANGGRDGFIMGDSGGATVNTGAFHDPIETMISNDPEYADGSRPVGETSKYHDFKPDITSLLEQRTSGYRNEAANTLIQREREGIEICIANDIETGEWDFFARNKDGEVVEGIPLPDKKAVGKVTFYGNSATDERNISYPVEEV